MHPTIHASAVLVGARAVLIRGPSGAGKSRLALRLIGAGCAGGPFVFARMVADDRVHMLPAAGRLVLRAPEAIAGRLEIRGQGIWQLPYEPVAVAGWVVDLDAPAVRLPDEAEARITIEGVTLPRFAFPACTDPLPVLVAALRVPRPEPDC